MRHIAKIFFYGLTVTLCTAAIARNEDGTLGLIRLPNNGVPVIIRNPVVFEVLLQSEAALQLRGNAGNFQLESELMEQPDGQIKANCYATSTIPPGTYSLHAQATTTEDINVRSVFVVDEFPLEYVIAHITDTHIGTTRHKRSDMEVIVECIEVINTSNAALVLITGDLTENGAPEQFQKFIEVLDRCTLPTFVVPGNHDRQYHAYSSFFESLTYSFVFGKDGYLAFDTKDFLIADEMRLQDGLMHRLRRRIRPSRWSIGFTHRYDPSMGMRAQLCLFVDDPLDYLFYGHIHREPGEQDGIPWGKTQAIITPAAIDGFLRFVDVTPAGITPREKTAAVLLKDDTSQ